MLASQMLSISPYLKFLLSSGTVHMFHVYVASVLSGCCVYLQWFQVFSCVFASVSYACFKCFICHHTYVASVVSKCFKNRSGVAHVAKRVRKRGGASGRCDVHA